MHKDLRRRYASAEALLRDVDHYLKGEALEAQPDSARYRMRKFVTRNRRAVTAAAAAVVLTAGLITFFTVRLAIARNAALAQAARTQRIQKFMTNLFQGGDEVAGPADSLRVVTLLDRGVQEAQSLNAEPVVQAELYETLGSIYQKLGKLDQANKLLQSALDSHKSHSGADSPEVAQTLVAIGQLRSDQARLDDAERFTQQGLQMALRHLPADNPAVVKAMLGRALEFENKFDDSDAVLKQALAIQERVYGPVHPSVAETLNELAANESMRNDMDGAIVQFRRVAEIYRSIYGDHHYLVAIALANVASQYMDKKDYASAEPIFRDVIRRLTEVLPPDNVNTGIARIKLGRTLLRQNRFAEAENQTHAGFDSLSKQMDPTVSWLRSARKDLVAEYTGMR